ncbi:MAG: hypothetical protein AABM42_10080 [Actinomycetota bacterium]
MTFLLPVLALAACGGGDDTTTTPTQTVTAQQQGGAPTKAEFIKEADALCQQFRDEAASARQELQDLRDPTSTEELHDAADLFSEYAGTLEQQAERLRQLEPPPGDETIINNWLSTGEGGISLLRDLADAVDSGDGQEIRSLNEQVQARFNEASGIAQGYGLTECGSGLA